MDSRPSPPSQLTAPQPWRTPRRLFLLGVILWCAIPLSPQSVDSDFWGHVQYGWDTWHRGLERTATYTFTAVGHPWINHENLSELIMAWGAYGWGPSSLLVLKCLLGCSVLALAIHRAGRERPAVHPLTIALVCVLVALNLSFYWGLRPHMFSFVLFALLVALHDACFEGWAGHWHLPWPKSASAANSPQLNMSRLHALWFAPILLAVWANTHGGFAAGVAVHVALLACRAGEVLVARGRTGWSAAAYLVVLAAAGPLATLLNPYGIGLHRWLLGALSVPRPEIQEWHPPAWLDGSTIPLWILLGVMACGLVASRRPRDLARLAVLALVLAETCKHQRHIPFLAILFLFWMPRHLQSVFDRLSGSRRTLAWPVSPPLVRVVSASLLLLCALLAYRVGTRFSDVPVSNYEYPVDALQFMADHGLTGRLVVAGHWAQYALAVMGAHSPDEAGLTVAFDGRFRTCYPQQVIDMHFDFFVGDGGPDQRYRSPLSPPADPKRVLRHGDPQLVLLNRHEPYPVAVMQSVQDQWVLLYQDHLAQLWGRRSIYDRQGSVDYFRPEWRSLAVAAPASMIPWPAAPTTRQDPALIPVSSATKHRPQTRHPE